jgi:hypothetical protein
VLYRLSYNPDDGTPGVQLFRGARSLFLDRARPRQLKRGSFIDDKSQYRQQRAFGAQGAARLFLPLASGCNPEISWLLSSSKLRALLSVCRFEHGGNSMQIAPLSERGFGGGRQDRRVTLSQIRAEGLGTSGQADWVQVRLGRGWLRVWA